jgi:hypothetical protein
MVVGLVLDAFRWLSATPLSIAIHESEWSFSIIETVHVLGLAAMAGTIAVVDLRLLGVVFRRQPVGLLLSQVLPVTWIGFALMTVSGLVLFYSEAEKLYANGAFWAKMALLVLAGLNPFIFHTTVYRTVGQWGEEAVIPARAKAAAVFSLLLWSAIIVLGRLIAYYPAEPVL